MARGALTPKREKFAQGVASGLSQADAQSHLEDLKRLRNMAARDKFRPGKCKHLRMTVDDEFVACDAAWG